MLKFVLGPPVNDHRFKRLYPQVVMDFIQHPNALENNRVLEFRLFRQKMSLNLQRYITHMDEYYYTNK